jgi:serine/threonine protein kinase
MLTGALPFNSRSLPKLIDAVYRGDKPAPSTLRPEIDPELESIVLRAMHPNHNERYGTAREFYEALEEFTVRPAYTPTARVPPLHEIAAGAPAKVATHWHLISVKNDSSERHAIHGDSIMVGRDRTCTIVLTHPAVSRRHARITISGPSFILEDLQSANGTYVNNARIEKAKLKAGDVVRFGADPSCSYVLSDH